MNRHGKDCARLVGKFLSGKQSFWEFHASFLDRWTRLSPGARTGMDREGWNEIYGWVLSSSPDPVPALDGARGVIGETELRQRLGRHPLLASPR